VLNYLLQAGDTADPEGFIRRLAEQSPRYEEVLMTIAQKLEQKGHQKGFIEGRQEGLQEGLNKGEKRGILKIACAMIDMGIDRETIMKTTGLSQNELEQIRH
ncbi:transposase, partial [Photorhabdus heterorhabditis]